MGAWRKVFPEGCDCLGKLIQGSQHVAQHSFNIETAGGVVEFP